MTTVALIGNPNCGKSTLFNRLTGAHRPVGNLPGVTVDIQSAPMHKRAHTLLRDLPGLYSLYPVSAEETLAREDLKTADVLLNVVDATHLQRHLYLTWQLLFWERPLVVAFNFSDRVSDADALARAWQTRLGVPVVPISAGKGQGLSALREALDRATIPHPPPLSRSTEEVLRKAESLLSSTPLPCPLRFTAMAVLDKDDCTSGKLPQNMVTAVQALGEVWRDDLYTPDMRLAQAAYRFIEEGTPPSAKPDLSARIDRLATHKVWGLLCFFVLAGVSLWLLFGPIGQVVGDTLGGLIDCGIAAVSARLMNWGVADFWRRLLCDGILAGVGATVRFCPQLMLLFCLLAIWEDSGYLARVAVVWDATLGRCGLPGRAILPLLCGFGCTVPAAMATRTLPHAADRRATLSLLPFCSCSARIPVYLLLTAVFFPHAGGNIAAIYLLGCGGALLQAIWEQRRRTEPRGALLLELPPYRFPTPTTLYAHISRHTRDFLSRVTTVLVLASTLLFLLQNISPQLQLLPAGAHEESLLFLIGRVTAPLLAPFGCDHPIVAVALLSGLLAKESIVGALAQGFASTGMSVSQGLSTLSPDAAAALLVFILLYSPCVAALAAFARERSRRFALWIAVRQTLYAWIAATATYWLLRWW